MCFKLLTIFPTESVSSHLLHGKLSTTRRIKRESFHSDEGLKLEMSFFESFSMANLPCRPRG